MVMPANAALPSTYDGRLVVLSFVVAIVGAYVGLTLSERISKHTGKSRHFWLAGGAIAFGSAIWAMHFTGMLALRLPVDVDYDAPLVVVSFLAGLVAAAVALYTVSRQRLTWAPLLGASVVMGAGIGAMHYIGMYAMRMPAMLHWDYRIVGLSVVVAVVLSLVALRLTSRLRAVSVKSPGWHRVVAACVMGSAIACMHYTGMAAATFVGTTAEPIGALDLSSDTVGATAIAFITLMVSGFAAIMAFIDRRFAAQDSALALSQRRLSMVVSNAPVALFAFDADGTITIAEGRNLSSMGHSAESMIGRSFFTVFAQVPALIEQGRRALRGDEHTALSTLGGVTLETHWTPVYTAGNVDSVIAVVTDITKRRRAEVALQHQALHDSLTGLPNRAFLNERLATELDVPGRSGAPVSLALIDLDRFKEVNDTMGHQAGDKLLQDIAVRLQGVLRDQDMIARYGGDEFAVMLPNTGDGDARAIARRLLAALAEPFMIKERSVDVGGSIGLAMSPPHGPGPATLLRQADVAMYAAKRGGGGCVFYDAALDHLEEQLRKALDEHAFVLAYQPIYELNGTLCGAEALLRWSQPDGTVVQPNDFIPFAEESGLIVPIGAWVLRTACAQNAAWNRAGLNVQVSVNVSTRQVTDPNFVQTVQAALRDAGLPPELLEIELTETAINANLDRIGAALKELRAFGVRVAIDDFGTGYNSLATLRAYDVDTLKIDRCFVTDIVASPVDRAIASAVITAAHALGARVVAEGIETTEQLAALIALHSDFGQGFLFSKAVAPELFERLPRQRRSLVAA
jgi:diguanylate cyclase (GGDEF)-like protein/PAS domain S-box-containing protein